LISELSYFCAINKIDFIKNKINFIKSKNIKKRIWKKVGNLLTKKNEAGAIALQLPPELQIRKPKQITCPMQAKEVKQALLTYLQSNFPGIGKLHVKFNTKRNHVMARARLGVRYLYAPAWNFEDCIAKFAYEYNTKLLCAPLIE